MFRKGWDLVDHYRCVDIAEIPDDDLKVMMEKLGIPNGDLYYYDGKDWHGVFNWKVTQIYGESKMQCQLSVRLDNGRRVGVQAMAFSLMQRKGKPALKKAAVKNANELLYKALDNVCDAHKHSCTNCPYLVYIDDTDTQECLLEQARNIALKEDEEG